MSSIVGTITLGGRPQGGTYVRLLGPSGEFVSEQYTKDDGRFRFHVTPGSWTVEARAAGARLEARTIEVGDTEAEAEIELSPTA